MILESVRLVRELEVGFAVISPDGATLAAADRYSFVVGDRDGTRRWRHDPRDGNVTGIRFSECSRWVVICNRPHTRLDSFDVATGAQLGTYEGTIFDYTCFDGRVIFEDNALQLPGLERGKQPLVVGGRFRCTADFHVEMFDEDVLLVDDARDRDVLLCHVPWATRAAVGTPGGRFVFATDHEELVVHDLTTGAVAFRFAIPSRFACHVSCSRDGRWLVASDGDASHLYELAWSGEQHDPLGDAWARVARPPIVDATLATVDKLSLAELERRARSHPELRLVLAARLPAARNFELTRPLLQEPAFAARPAVWAQLARAALQLGRFDEAADAAAEGLGRDESDETLHAILVEARAALAAPSYVPTRSRVRSWRAHDRVIDVIATADRILTIGNDGARDMLSVWRLDGTLVESVDAHGDSRLLALAADHVLVAGANGLFAWRLPAAIDGRLADPRTVLDTPYLEALDVTAAGDLVVYAPLRLVIARLPRTIVSERELSEPARNLCVYGDELLLSLKDRVELRSLASATRRSIAVVADALAAPADAIVVGTGLELRRYDWATLDEIDVLEGHRATLSVVVHRGSLLVSVDHDDAIRWWRDGEPIAMASHAGFSCIAIAPDGTTLTGSTDGELVVWA